MCQWLSTSVRFMSFSPAMWVMLRVMFQIAQVSLTFLAHACRNMSRPAGLENGHCTCSHTITEKMKQLSFVLLGPCLNCHNCIKHLRVTNGMALVDNVLGELSMIRFGLTDGSAICGACAHIEADGFHVLRVDDEPVISSW